MISVIIPAHKEPHLQRTIDGVHKSAKEKVEIIVALDDYWPEKPLTDCVTIHAPYEIGMRTAINVAVSQASGKYIMKCDGHCAFKPGFDVELIRDCQPDWVLVPVLYQMDIDTFTCIGKKREFFYINKQDYRGNDWREYPDRVKGQMLCDLMTMQGSCWFMERDWFDTIGGEDDVNYGNGGREAQEISIKTWEAGGKCILDRNVWYAHWRKPSGNSTVRRANRDKSKKYIMERYKDLKWLIDRFAPVPSWE